MPKALEIRRGIPVSSGRRAEPPEWAKPKLGGAPGPGPEAAVVQIPDRPVAGEDSSFGTGVEFYIGHRDKRL